MKRALSTLILLISIVLSTWAQEGQTLKLKFHVVDEANNILKGMTVRLYDRNDIVEEIQRAPSKNTFELTEFSIYTIEVELQGFVTKRITVNTESFEGKELNKDGYSFDILLERKTNYRGVENAEDVLEYPSAILDLDTNRGRIDANEKYEMSTQKAFEEMIRKGKEIKF